MSDLHCTCGSDCNKHIRELESQLAAVTQELEQIKFEYAECELRTSGIIDDQQAELEQAKAELNSKQSIICQQGEWLEVLESKLEQLKQSSVVMPEDSVTISKAELKYLNDHHSHCETRIGFTRVFLHKVTDELNLLSTHLNESQQELRQALANDKEKDSE